MIAALSTPGTRDRLAAETPPPQVAGEPTISSCQRQCRRARLLVRQAFQPPTGQSTPSDVWVAFRPEQKTRSPMLPTKDCTPVVQLPAWTSVLHRSRLPTRLRRRRRWCHRTAAYRRRLPRALAGGDLANTVLPAGSHPPTGIAFRLSAQACRGQDCPAAVERRCAPETRAAQAGVIQRRAVAERAEIRHDGSAASCVR